MASLRFTAKTTTEAQRPRRLRSDRLNLRGSRSSHQDRRPLPEDPRDRRVCGRHAEGASDVERGDGSSQGADDQRGLRGIREQSEGRGEAWDHPAKSSADDEEAEDAVDT